MLQNIITIVHGWSEINFSFLKFIEITSFHKNIGKNRFPHTFLVFEKKMFFQIFSQFPSHEHLKCLVMAVSTLEHPIHMVSP